MLFKVYLLLPPDYRHSLGVSGGCIAQDEGILAAGGSLSIVDRQGLGQAGGRRHAYTRGALTYNN